ncbi:MAG: Crp/Fnr family transcriptional regulator [Synergistaceae bacterium]|jgi:CRP-like cAMP-binding protein|nr:Crp/Fnr family transcriptional regulator [Synergistaceae bacterium]
MKKFLPAMLPAIKKCALFATVDESDLEALLNCLGATTDVFEKNDFIFRVDDAAVSVGLVLSGGVHVLQEDFWGNRAIVARVESGDSFGEAFSCAGVEKLPVAVVAAERSEVLFLDYGRTAGVCSSVCPFHVGLIENMMRILAEKNIALTQKMEHLTRRTTREKLLSWLSEQARRAGSNSFEIPFNRQELAEYLSVDRSAMSAELSKMRKENLLRCERSRFELLRGCYTEKLSGSTERQQCSL